MWLEGTEGFRVSLAGKASRRRDLARQAPERLLSPPVDDPPTAFRTSREGPLPHSIWSLPSPFPHFGCRGREGRWRAVQGSAGGGRG